MLKIAYIGNFERTYSTENHVRTAFESHGHVVTQFQEGNQQRHADLLGNLSEFDLILWTRTGEFAGRIGVYEQWRLITEARKAGVPTVSYHLDRWWGLNRQNEITDQPYFRTDLVITPDGAHDDMWERVGVNHVWMNPAVSAQHTGRGTPRERWMHDLVFVGTFRSYHKEWQHRVNLVHELTRTYRNRIQFLPNDGVPIREFALNDLYASAKIVIGDSCLAPGFGGREMTHYTSDRVPETVGRGGFLFHPQVTGVTDGEVYENGKHLVTWKAGEWGTLKGLINRLLSDDAKRQEISDAGMAHVIANHTYEVRAGQIVALLHDRGLL